MLAESPADPRHHAARRLEQLTDAQRPRHREQRRQPCADPAGDPDQPRDEFGKLRAIVTLSPNDKDKELWDAIHDESNAIGEVIVNEHEIQLFTPQAFKILSAGADLKQEIP